jgi:hypothetical protein
MNSQVGSVSGSGLLDALILKRLIIYDGVSRWITSRCRERKSSIC